MSSCGLNIAKRVAAAAKFRCGEPDTVVDATAPELVAKPGVGTHTAAALLVTAGDNRERLKDEGSFAPDRHSVAGRSLQQGAPRLVQQSAEQVVCVRMPKLIEWLT